ncbi:MAG: transcription elongation factor GreA [Eubacterium sp.]|jgi:transcription elongation factor GreA|nr:transcription elongation factor GreA [Eubacterium sp.]MBQ2053570.1 transcription elongation factor GreA [Eubacterium sp.]MEE3399704.1 transcription elongation factor GreA [Eubacterium sp.]
MEDKKKQITYEELKNLEDELSELKNNRRKEIAEKIKEAREQGDLSENAEYDAAKDEQRDIESRIAELEDILKHVEVIDESNLDTESVFIGCTVHFVDMESKQEFTYKISSSTGANILAGKISVESPIGSKLIGSKVGQVITVDAPNGRYSYKILDFKRDKNK